MRSVRVEVSVPQQRADVYAFLDVLANHQGFNDHMLCNWELSGPARGVGARARVDAVTGGRRQPVEIEVIAAEAPVRNVERNTGAGGRRVATGTYTLAALPGGGTRVGFEYAWQRAPLGERIAGPVVRRLLRKDLLRAMARLAEELGAGEADGVDR